MNDYFRDFVCPNCGSTNFDGSDCDDCGFDVYCYDPYWD